jgi:putative hydrolase
VTRGEWARATLEGWTWLLEHLAERFADELNRLGGQTTDEGNPMQASLAQVGPLLSGMQAGTLVGQLSREALTRYDIPIPRADDHRLTFVAPNLDEVMRDYDLERGPFVSWVALHETARHLLATSVPWLERYLRSLLVEVVDAVEIDPADIERRFVELSSAGMEGLGEGKAPGNILPITPTERHGRAVRRLTSFLSVAEGYASSAVGAVAGEMLPDRARIDEGMARRRAAPGEGRAALESLLGIASTRAHEHAGATFCAAVVKLKGMAALNRLWEAPDNLPLPEEIKDPFSWIERQGL